MDESFHNWVRHSDEDDWKFWESWLSDHPDKMQEVNQAKRIVKTISFKDKSFSKDEINAIWQKIKSETKETDARTVRFNPWRYLRIAAVIVPFVIASVLFLFFREIPVTNESVTQVEIVKQNPKGEKRTVFFSDGSKVILNAESKISYLKPFSINERVIRLEGEAFFEVTPDRNRPFVVKSGSLETRVLGTSFNVKAYPNDKRIEVAVKTGSVSVESLRQNPAKKHDELIVLSPREMASYSLETNRTTITEYDPLKVLAWSEGILYFDDATIEEFVTAVERWYGVEIIVDRDKPIAKGITGTFKDESLDQILEGTKGTSEFEYEFISAGKVLIK